MTAPEQSAADLTATVREAMDSFCEFHAHRWSEECVGCEYAQESLAALDALAALAARAEEAEKERDEAQDAYHERESELVFAIEDAEAEVARLVAFLQFNRSGRPRQAGPTLQEIATALADKEGT